MQRINQPFQSFDLIVSIQFHFFDRKIQTEHDQIQLGQIHEYQSHWRMYVVILTQKKNYAIIREITKRNFTFNA